MEIPVEYENLEPSIQNIIDRARIVRGNAYCPYSNFSVGAALLCEDGSVIEGCNVENVSYGLTICAERSAVVRGVAQGKKNFVGVAICAEMKEHFVGPCGACRQVLAEFNPDMDIYLCKPTKSIVKTSLASLLPMSFNPRWVTFNNEN